MIYRLHPLLPDLLLVYALLLVQLLDLLQPDVFDVAMPRVPWRDDGARILGVEVEECGAEHGLACLSQRLDVTKGGLVGSTYREESSRKKKYPN